MSAISFLRESPVWILLGWSVALSLTLGAAAAALAFLSRGLPSSLGPRRRYQFVGLLYVLSLVAALFLAAAPRRPASTPAPGGLPHAPLGQPLAGVVIPVPPGPAVVRGDTPVAEAAQPVRNLVPLAAIAWLVASCLGAVRLGAGLWRIGRVARRAIRLDDLAVDELLNAVRARLGIRASIDLRESTDVDTPVTGGWVRPFVLLPAGMASALDPADLELVLAHELAHVRRRDFPVAVLQALGDAATALSPGHRWLSNEASRLREEACDDAVVGLGVAPARYARALEGLARWSRGQQVSQGVCAANRYLLERVRRLVGARAGLRPGLPATLGLIAVLFAAVAASGLAAKASPGLPRRAAGTHPRKIGPTLVAWRDLAGGGAATQQTPEEIRAFLETNGIFPGYSFHQESSPVRLGDVVASHAFVYDHVSLRNVFSKRIDAVTFAAIVERLPDPVTIVRSSPVPMSLDPDQSATARVQVLPIDQANALKQGGRVQPLLVIAAVTFEDGVTWNALLNDKAQTTSAVLGTHDYSLPRSFVSASLPTGSVRDIPSCYSGYTDDDQQSQGAILPIRGEPDKWARCVEGRWLEIDIRKLGGEPEHSVEDLRRNTLKARPQPN